MAERRISHPAPDSQALALPDIVEFPAREETVRNAGAEHPVDGLIEYLAQASPNSLSNMALRNAGEASERRREVMDIVEAWVDAKAIERQIGWQTRQPRKVNGSAPAAVREPLPDDVTPLDPFFRPQGQSQAIRRELTPSQFKKWSEHFRRFGCLGKTCDERENYGADGFCVRCVTLMRRRMEGIVADLRLEAARVSGRLQEVKRELRLEAATRRMN